MDIIKDMTPVMMTVTQDINNYIRRFFLWGWLTKSQIN